MLLVGECFGLRWLLVGSVWFICLIDLGCFELVGCLDLVWVCFGLGYLNLFCLVGLVCYFLLILVIVYDLEFVLRSGCLSVLYLCLGFGCGYLC